VQAVEHHHHHHHHSSINSVNADAEPSRTLFVSLLTSVQQKHQQRDPFIRVGISGLTSSRVGSRSINNASHTSEMVAAAFQDECTAADEKMCASLPPAMRVDRVTGLLPRQHTHGTQARSSARTLQGPRQAEARSEPSGWRRRAASRGSHNSVKKASTPHGATGSTLRNDSSPPRWRL
jgi:hypothetical protein